MRTWASIMVAAAALIACDPYQAGDEPVIWLDPVEYERAVQPILGEQCGNPSCHGRADRPLAIYSVGQWRADADDTHLPDPLTREELEHNYVAACAFASHGDSPTEALLLLKPRADTAGVHHGGGVIWDGELDPDYRTIRDWIERGGGP